jgi:predicted AAA+ superfamily ATPase
MALTNNERVGKALDLLSVGLAPFVEREFKAEWGAEWLQYARKDERAVSPSDTQFLLGAMMAHWQKVFDKVLGRAERNYVGELITIRNNWAHQVTFTSDDTYRALDTAHRLLTSAQATDAAAQLDKMRQELLRIRFTEQARTIERRKIEKAIEGQPQAGLSPWRDVVTPHRDVREGKYTQAEFAADLHQVWRDEAEHEYNDPVEFFRRTFITDGMRGLLTNAIHRLRGEGGDPIVQLQTNFGGGKTHSLIALYHLASGYAAKDLPGIDALLAEAAIDTLPANVNKAVLVGQQIAAGETHPKGDGTVIRTLWGELAYQLGGQEAYALLAQSDARGTNPGSLLTDILRKCAPCLILIDEWVAYARVLYGKNDLPAGTFDTQMTFAQALCDAAHDVPNALMVVTIPASDIEIGGEGGRKALERLSNVVGRMETSWRPATADEGFEIVRRRLFEEIPTNKVALRDVVVRAFGAMYKEHAGEFPLDAREGDYVRRMTASYPIHPEMFDRLYGDWSTLDKFQRTRGALRLMASVIYELWIQGDAGLMILPSSVPVHANTVRPELLRYLEDGWAPVIETDVDGPNSLPLQIDEGNTNLGRFSATRRVARAIYMGSAPTANAATSGIDDRHIKLACVQPGESPAIFGDALRHLSNRATYLVNDSQRYWYSLQQTVARLAKDRALTHFPPDAVDHHIAKRLERLRERRGSFAGVHVAPTAPSEVPDEPTARLVVLGPSVSHTHRVETSPARIAADQILRERASGQRLYRNMLVFLAADERPLEDLRDATRQYLAWKSIEDDAIGSTPAVNLDSIQKRQVVEKVKEFNETVERRIAETYQLLLVPSGDATGATVTWEDIRASGDGSPVERAAGRLEATDHLYTRWSGTNLRLELDKVPLWRGDSVGLRQLWQDFAQYLYLPRLKDSSVLVKAVESGVGNTGWSMDGFAYADSYDEDAKRYRGLIGGAVPTVLMQGEALLVKADVALRQLEEEASARGDAPTSTSYPMADGNGASGESIVRYGLEAGGPLPATHARPRRFYGKKTLDVVRMAREVGDISEAIVAHLANSPNSKVTISIEIEAESGSGFDDGVRRIVSENANTLKLDSSEFEAE